ncbi:MAG: guanylate kinase [Desulfosarcina sp.]|nr:guanylate kinase [Desulfobacterales bacterium]
MSVQRPVASGAESGTRKENTSRPQWRLFILSAPSGAGKSTLCGILREQLPTVRYSISYTTRAPRSGEVDGREYFFIDEAAFEDGITTGRWVEWARVHGNYYGTSEAFIDRMLAAGHDLLLDIDVQGAAQLVQRYPEAVTIFITPPSMDILRQRLEKRGTDAPDVIAARLVNARAEMAERSRYRHIVVNDRLERAARELVALLEPNDRPVPAET